MNIDTTNKTVEFELRGSLSFNDMVRNYKTSFLTFSEKYKVVKGGITGSEPQSTFNNFLKEFNWERMIIIYNLQDSRNVMKMEDYIFSCYPEILPNWMGTKDINDDGDNYFYFLMK